MKSKFLCLALAVCFGVLSATPARALDDYSPEAVVTDVLIVRPACLVVTIFGAAFFFIALPPAAIAGNVSQTADSLITIPARATFTRNVGNFSDLQ